jgi:hypothetical protein
MDDGVARAAEGQGLAQQVLNNSTSSTASKRTVPSLPPALPQPRHPTSRTLAIADHCAIEAGKIESDRSVLARRGIAATCEPASLSKLTTAISDVGQFSVASKGLFTPN